MIAFVYRRCAPNFSACTLNIFSQGLQCFQFKRQPGALYLKKFCGIKLHLIFSCTFSFYSLSDIVMYHQRISKQYIVYLRTASRVPNRIVRCPSNPIPNIYKHTHIKPSHICCFLFGDMVMFFFLNIFSLINVVHKLLFYFIYC